MKFSNLLFCKCKFYFQLRSWSQYSLDYLRHTVTQPHFCHISQDKSGISLLLINLDFNFTVSCKCVEVGWKVAELVSVMKEFIFQVTAPDNVQTHGMDGEGFVFEVHLTANNKKIQANNSYHKLSDDLWFTNWARLRNTACLQMHYFS